MTKLSHNEIDLHSSIFQGYIKENPIVELKSIITRDIFCNGDPIISISELCCQIKDMPHNKLSRLES